MKRTAIAAVSVFLALPGSALAASSSGTVLSVDSHHHALQVVDGHHAVHAYRYRGRLPRLHAGSLIRYQARGHAISHVRVVSNRRHTVSFLGRVVRSNSKALVLRLADGRTVQFSPHQLARHGKSHLRHRGRVMAHAAGAPAGGITISITGLQPGVVVLITESVDAQGNITITITLPSPQDLGGQQTASGVVADVSNDTFTVDTGDGSELVLHMAQDKLAAANLNPCDTVNATYHQDAGMLIADSVEKTGTSNSDWCAGDPTLQDEVGTITQVSSDSVTVNTADHGSMTFALDDPSLSDGFQVGDVVDVTYSDNGDGTFTAVDVEYVEQDATGTVTAVADGIVTITNSDNGQSQTFTADPAEQMFDGVAVGDQVDVTYHQSAGQLVADAVDDSGPADGGDGGDGGDHARH